MLTIYLTDMQILQLKNGATYVNALTGSKVGEKINIKNWQTCDVEMIAFVSEIICGSIIKIEGVKINEMR